MCCAEGLRPGSEVNDVVCLPPRFQRTGVGCPLGGSSSFSRIEDHGGGGGGGQGSSRCGGAPSTQVMMTKVLRRMMGKTATHMSDGSVRLLLTC